MTEEIYKRSITTGRVQLIGFWQKLSHYGLVGYLLFIPLMIMTFHLVSFLQNEPDSFPEGELGMIPVPLILAAMAYRMQKQRLKFTIVSTNLKRIQLKEILIEVSKELAWEFVSATDDAYVAKTDPGFWSGSWGEQVTILFYGDRVFVNSICALDRRPSVISMGRNKKNVCTLIDKINATQLIPNSVGL